jgi:hypothetical protein
MTGLAGQNRVHQEKPGQNSLPDAFSSRARPTTYKLSPLPLVTIEVASIARHCHTNLICFNNECDSLPTYLEIVPPLLSFFIQYLCIVCLSVFVFKHGR